jgi:hypothetical protein
MEEITINKFEIQSARTDCFIAVTELEKLFGSLESGEIPEDLETVKRFTLDRLRKRHTRLLAVEAGDC